MIARDLRLRRASDFAKVYKYGRSFGTKDLFIKAIKTNYDLSHTAIVVSKKVSKKAVVRNKIKRKGIELLRKRWDRLKPGYNIVVTVKKDISGATEAEFEKQIFFCLERLGIASKKA